MAFLTPVRTANAQTKNRVAVGVNIAAKMATDDDARGTYGPGFTWRFGTSKEGWKLKYGLNWYRADIDRDIAGEVQAFGKLRLRPITVGYGYTHMMGRTSISANLVGGYSFNSFTAHDTAVSALRSSLAASTIVADVSNGFLLKPEISLWRNVSQKIGVNFNVGYVISRPFLTLEADGVQDRRRFNADAMAVSMGVVYSVF